MSLAHVADVPARPPADLAGATIFYFNVLVATVRGTKRANTPDLLRAALHMALRALQNQGAIDPVVPVVELRRLADEAVEVHRGEIRAEVSVASTTLAHYWLEAQAIRQAARARHLATLRALAPQPGQIST